MVGHRSEYIQATVRTAALARHRAAYAAIAGSFRPRIMSDAFSPIIAVGACVLPLMRRGMIEASAIRSAETPRTRSYGSTTACSSLPIRQVPTG